jgi:DNA repair photolyase
VAVTYIPYKAKKILNIHKRIDGGWFWNKYSAYPYIGCQFGCEFCYEREPKYLPYPDPDAFDKAIKIKLNAPELLKRELSRVPVDLIATGDYQPAEKEFKLSRQLLEVAFETGFPVFILERSPLVTRDLDLIKAINEKTFAAVLFSTSFADFNTAKRIFEPKSPAVKLRFKAMGEIASQGILSGTAFMPILPYISDSEADLEAVVKMTKDSGGSFVLAGGLTLSGYQKERYLSLMSKNYPELMPKYDKLYERSYGPNSSYWVQIANQVRELCYKHSINDRMPRWIHQGNLAANKKIAEILFLKVYDLELARENENKIWAYRKAAWTIDELDKSIGQIYTERGIEGLLAIPSIGKKLAREIEAMLQERSRNGHLG